MILVVGIALYFSILLSVSYFTSRNIRSDSYALADRKSHWAIVSLGMIGDSLSGVSFLSVPGRVYDIGFSYFQLVLGYLVGYEVIARILLPHFYKLKSPSIYKSLGISLGYGAESLGSFCFILSRVLGSGVRLFLSVSVLYQFYLKEFGMPYELVAALTLLFIYFYTYKGGMKTLVWTDAVQSTALVLGLFTSAGYLIYHLHLDLSSFLDLFSNQEFEKFTRIFHWDFKSASFFPKEFISGAFIAIVMTGLDQNIMQKALTCPELKDSQKNIRVFSYVLLPVNWVILSLGFLLILTAQREGWTVPEARDQLFPQIVRSIFPDWVNLFFVMGLVASMLSSADAVLTTLSTSFRVDVLPGLSQKSIFRSGFFKKSYGFHAFFSVLLLSVVIGLGRVSAQSAVHLVFILASYTYAPILGLFLLRGLRKQKTQQPFSVYLIVSILSASLTRMVELRVSQVFGYKFNYETLLLNSFLFVAFCLLFRPTRSTAKGAS